MILGRLFLFAFLLVFLMPAESHAAAVKPSCTLTASTNRGSVETSDSLDVLVPMDHPLTIAWQSTGATRATGPSGAADLSGTTEVYPIKKTTYTYTFRNGNQKTRCSVTAHVVNGGIDYAYLTSTKPKPYLHGVAVGLKSVRLEFTHNGVGDPFYVSHEIKVKKGQWEFVLPQALADGTYQVNLYGSKKLSLNYIVTGTLTITTAGVPFVQVVLDHPLMGGLIKAGTEFPVADLRVTNTSNGLATIHGFWLQQKGNAPDMAIVGFGIKNQQGDRAGGAGGIEGYTPLINNLVSIPISSTLAPGETEVYTITGALSRNASKYANQQIRLDVHSLQSVARAGNTFPIIGPVYTITP